MTLTKEILEEIISIDDKYTSRHRDEDIAEILRNQELAKGIEESGFRFITERDFVIMAGIIERLNKEIVNYESIGKTGDDNYDEETGDVINLLQKIFGEKEANK